MRIGVIRERKPGETRVAATPKTVEQLRGLGYEVSVESGAGEHSSFADDAYAAAGADVVGTGQASSADVVFMVNAPSTAQLDELSDGATIVGLFSPALDPDLVEELARRPVTALAMDAVPRISRAQSLDVL